MPRMICVLRQDKCSLWPEWLDVCWICQHQMTFDNVKFGNLCVPLCVGVCLCMCGTLNSSSSSAEFERVNKTPDNAAYSEISWQHTSYAQYSSSILKLLCGRRTRRTLRATVSHTHTHKHTHTDVAMLPKSHLLIQTGRTQRCCHHLCGTTWCRWRWPTPFQGHL